MTDSNDFDVAIIGGSYAGLSAAMTLGRALRNVVIIDSGKPCNRQTPHSHNLVTQDGKTPAQISAEARTQVLAYPSVSMREGLAVSVTGSNNAFSIQTESGDRYQARKIIFATGLHDIMPDLPGFAECWGISVVHCPYCHGYEYTGMKTGVLLNGEMALDFVRLIRNWTADLTLYTNGPAKFDGTVKDKILAAGVAIVEEPIESLDHESGHLKSLHFKDGTSRDITALYNRPAFVQHCPIPQELGCAMTALGHIKVDEFQKTTIPGIYAAGDNTSMLRGLTAALAAGTMAGARINHELIQEQY